jgi:hypothetical protein
VGDPAARPLGRIECVADDDLVPLDQRDLVARTSECKPGGQSADARTENGYGQSCHRPMLRDPLSDRPNAQRRDATESRAVFSSMGESLPG